MLTVLFKENILSGCSPFEQKEWFYTSTLLLKVTSKAERYNVLWYKFNEKQSKGNENLHLLCELKRRMSYARETMT